MNTEKFISETLPQGPKSADEYRDIFIRNLDKILDKIPTLPTMEVNLATLEKLEVGTYLMKERPSIDLLKQLPDYRDGQAEVAILCVNGRWLICLNNEMKITLPYQLEMIEYKGVFQFDMHSHPGDDSGSRLPSDSDISKLESTIDGKNYIISKAGLIEFQWLNNLPGNYPLPVYAKHAWKHWIVKDLKLTKEEYDLRGEWNLWQEFCEKFFGLRIIPWENTKEIEEILKSKESLKKEKQV